VTPLTASRRQRGPDTRAAVACYYAGDPALRPHCTVTAEITLGPVPLCRSCGRARSTLGKGITPAPLPPGPVIDVLDWVADASAAARQAQLRLSAAVTRARSAGSTWAQIAGRLGVTRQAARQRFGQDSLPGSLTRSRSPRPPSGAPPVTAAQERTPS
jgi:hypothetical protein